MLDEILRRRSGLIASAICRGAGMPGAEFWRARACWWLQQMIDDCA